MCERCKSTRRRVPYNTETISERIKQVHGDKFRTDKLVYRGWNSKIELVCPVHGSIFVMPGNILSGQGCYKCGRIKSGESTRSNTETFIKKSTAIHGDQYDYSRVNYRNAVTKVEVYCKTHRVYFLISPNKHLCGRGCKLCGIENTVKALTKPKDKFLEVVTKLHVDNEGKPLYIYDAIDYINTSSKLKIYCKFHDKYFIQSADMHLAGQGCPDCGNIKRTISQTKTQQVFIDQVAKKHGNKYSYHETVYKTDSHKVKIFCKHHKEFFYQKAGNHIRGDGCPKCGKERASKSKTRSTEEFINRAKAIHDNLYDYSRVVYVTDRTKVFIRCLKHNHWFQQTPNKHLYGQGCPICRSSTGELFIASVLKKHNITFEREKRIDGSLFRYDFYLPDHNVYIEFHGHQHFIPVPAWGGEEALTKIKERDLVKENLIQQINSMLLVYTYLELKDNTLECALLQDLVMLRVLDPKIERSNYIPDTTSHRYRLLRGLIRNYNKQIQKCT